MKYFLNGVQFTIIFSIFIPSVISSWEFAVTTKGEIKFYDANWNVTTSAAQHLDELSAITFDETEEILYFNDQSHNISSIFSLQLSKENDYNHRIENLVAKTQEEFVQGIAYDALDRVLYWTDSKNKIIYQLSVDHKNNRPKIFLQLNDTKIPKGIAIDVCRRKLYWTNANIRNPTIERASIDGKKYEILLETNLLMPSSIAVDQFSKRIYWVHSDVDGLNYSIESAALDGTDRKYLVRDKYNAPFNLAVDHENIYWTDSHNTAVWKISKNHNNDSQIGPEKILKFINNPKGIIARGNLLSTQSNNPECSEIVNKIKSTLVAPNSANVLTTVNTTNNYSINICMNNGELNKRTNTCICTNEYEGVRCEISRCHNFCFEGTCYVSSMGYPQCSCYTGYIGERCEQDLCYGFCLNGGRCSIERYEPVCQCLQLYHGRHCEYRNVQEICRYFCDSGIDNSEMNLMELCGNCNTTIIDTTGEGNTQKNVKNFFQNNNTCGGNSLNKTAVFVTVGVVLSLSLAFLIIMTLRRHYIPLRPKIKKTYVVHKKVKTPLTCRPTTEQCEITIENCCNMNICDTPCFDPKSIQQEISKKEDKKNLLDNMERDLY